MVAELILIPQNPKSLDSAKQCAQYVARALSAAGIKAREQLSICTGKAELQKAVATALGRSNVVLLLGGLTADQSFLSKMVVSKGLRLPLEQDRGCLEAIRAYCDRAGEFYLEEDARLAEIPKGATVFPGQYGKVPGMAISSAKQHIILLPTNQTEAAAMLPQYIIPYLGGRDAEASVTRTVRTYGVGKEHARAVLCELLDTANPAVTLDKEGSEVLIRVSAHAESAAEANKLCIPVLKEIIDRMGDAAYGLDVDSLQTAVVQRLSKKGLDISVAESGCQGILTRVLSETPGGADILRYCKAADDDATKQHKLNVSAKLLKKKGGVSEEAAVAMADAARQKGKSDIGVAITAGTRHSGKKKSKDRFGLVYIAVCDANNVYVKKLVVGSGDPGERDSIVDASLSRALNMLRLFVDYLPGAYPGAIRLDEALAGKTVTQGNGGVDDGSGGKDEGFFGRLLDNFIIRKADEPTTKVRKFIFILAVLVFLGSAGYVGNYYYESWTAAKQAQQLASLFTYGDQDVEISEDFPKDFLAQFAALWSINPDVVGYLSIEGTALQYPVVKAENNDYYLRRDFYGSSNQYGIPFMDFRVDVERPSDNMVIYGHNMKDGQMFGELVNYRKLDYYKEHPVIDFSTVYSQDQYKIISVFLTNAYEAQGSPLFDYHNFIDASNIDAFMDYVDQVRVRSLINTPVDVTYTDKLLTLSTCEYDFSEARLVVVARRVRSGESAAVDVSQAVENPNPLYPRVWYELYGGAAPDVGSATIVTEPSVNRAPSQPESPSVADVEPASSSQTTSSQSESQDSSSESVLEFYRDEEESASQASQSEEEIEQASPAPSQSESEQAAESEQPSGQTGDEPTLFDFISAGKQQPAGRYYASAAAIAPVPVDIDLNVEPLPEINLEIDRHKDHDVWDAAMRHYRIGMDNTIATERDYPDDYLVRFNGFWGINHDVVGFLEVAGTSLYCPVVQAPDNNYYQRRNFFGEHDTYGIPFVDYRVDVKVPSANTIVYGNNEKAGQVMGELVNYTNLSYYKSHPVIDFTTVYRDGKYKILGVFIADSNDKSENAFVYDDFINGGEVAAYIEQVRQRSLINTTVDYNANDSLLTLSTQHNAFDGARLVVVARRVRTGESAAVDVSKAVLNASPQYPQAWYGNVSATGSGKTYFASSGWILPDETKEVDELANAPSLFDFMDDPPRSGGSSGFGGGSGNYVSTLTVTLNGSKVTMDTEELVMRIVQQEMGSAFHEEALKAQAVAAYSYVLFHNNLGQAPNVLVASSSDVTDKVKKAVSQVLGDTVVYNGKAAFTAYHATSAGQTTTSASVWGTGYPYLVTVDSPVDKETTHYKVVRTYNSDYVSSMLYEKMGISTWGDPEDWFEILSYNAGGYVGEMAICGETVNPKTGKAITGRYVRESVFNLRSHYFKITYDDSTDLFTFTTYGYGHGVGMSQNGAHLYAQQGWNYIQILEHYFPGTRVQ